MKGTGYYLQESVLSNVITLKLMTSHIAVIYFPADSSVVSTVTLPVKPALYWAGLPSSRTVLHLCSIFKCSCDGL